MAQLAFVVGIADCVRFPRPPFLQNVSLVDKIANHGFDERVSNLAGMFGCGIYFAENSSKSVIYAHAATCPQSGAVYIGQNSVCNCTGTETL